MLCNVENLIKCLLSSKDNGSSLTVLSGRNVTVSYIFDSHLFLKLETSKLNLFFHDFFFTDIGCVGHCKNPPSFDELSYL